MTSSQDSVATSPGVLAERSIESLIEALYQFKGLAPLVDSAALVLLSALREGKKVLTCGNGGSAADALHMSEELLGRYKRERQALPAICLAADPTVMTCIGNDYGFENLFVRQIEGLGRPGDVLVLFSSSGNSGNLVKALAAARLQGLTTISLLGRGGGKMAGHADHDIIVPSDETARVQEIHTLVLHTWLEYIDAAFAK